MGDTGAKWCILRTSGSRTLALAQSLTAAGFEVWTPQETQSRRKAGSKVVVVREAPIMPSFVFARAEQLSDLARALALPVSRHPQFSIFRHDGRIPLVADRSLKSLREAEERNRMARLKTKRHVVPVGEKVKPTEGAFAGLDGVVEEADGRFALVCFNGSFRVRIASWLLGTDEVQGRPACMGDAAKAA